MPDRAIAILLGAAFFLIFFISPIRRMGDSKYSLLVSQSLLEHGTFYVNQYRFPFGRGEDSESFKNRISIRKGIPYQLERHQKRLYYYFPPGTSIISTPFVALSMVAGKAPARGGVYSARNERELQFVIGSALMGALAGVLYLSSRMLLSPASAVFLTIVGSLGSMVWSTASRGLPSHTWGIFLLTIIVYLLLKERTANRTSGAAYEIVLATLLSWTFFIRPTFALSIAAIAVYRLYIRRRIPTVFVAGGVFWLAAFLIYSHLLFDQWVPNYYLPGRINPGFGKAFWGTLSGVAFSPSRGVFIYLPTLLVCFYWIFKYRKTLQFKSLVVLAIAVILSHVVLISSFRQWWGGHSYGPRLFTDVLPWCFLLAILALRARKDSFHSQSDRSWLPWLERSFISIFLISAILLHGMGAWSEAVWKWNGEPIDIDKDPDRVWDWRDPQFAAPFKKSKP